MDYEDYLAESYIPMKAIEVLSDIIYLKCNEDWSIFSEKMTRAKGEELLALNFVIKLCADYLLNQRSKELNAKTFYTQAEL